MILLTGANGFIGKELATQLEKRHLKFKCVIRKESLSPIGEGSTVRIDSISPHQDWEDVLPGIDSIIHTAARVHVMNDDSMDPLIEFHKVNTEGTLKLARQASQAGVKRFIYLSSIKVNGESTEFGENFLPDDKFVPDDPYGLSKYEAEQGLLAVAKETDMEVVIIRPPLVYGPGVKANFSSMMKWVNKGVPLPFGAVHNKRSLVALDNLVDFIIHCISHPKAANEVFLISDGYDVSTTELLQKVAKAFGKRAFLIPVPVSLMKFAARLLGKGDVSDRLFGSLQVDSSKVLELLGWKPVITMDDELKITAEAYLNERIF